MKFASVALTITVRPFANLLLWLMGDDDKSRRERANEKFRRWNESPYGGCKA